MLECFLQAFDKKNGTNFSTKVSVKCFLSKGSLTLLSFFHRDQHRRSIKEDYRSNLSKGTNIPFKVFKEDQKGVQGEKLS